MLTISSAETRTSARSRTPSPFGLNTAGARSERRGAVLSIVSRTCVCRPAESVARTIAPPSKPVVCQSTPKPS